MANPVVLHSYEDEATGDVQEMMYAPWAGLAAILLANPCQILWELLTVTLQKTKINKDNTKQGCFLLSYQVLVSFLYIFILFYAIHFVIRVSKSGDSFLVFGTFLATYLVD